MMLYIEYEAYKAKYKQTQQELNKILNEEEALFTKTQPKGLHFMGDGIHGGKQTNSFDWYLEEKEHRQIDERLAEIRAILIDRAQLAELKRKELLKSQLFFDRLYVAKYIKGMTITKMANIFHYSERSIYRYLRLIQRTLAENGKNPML